MAATILIIANDKTITDALAASFNRREFSTIAVHSGRQALVQAKSQAPDVIILDTTSSRLNTRRLARSLRAEMRAILITLAANPARSDTAGIAHLVLPKTTTPKKLVQRVRSALDSRPPRELRVANLLLDMERRRVSRGNRVHKLTPKEFDLLRLFMEHSGEIISRKALMKEIWDTDYLGDTRTLDVHIRWLREKIEEDPSAPRRLVTIRGEGYRLESKPQ